MNILDLEEQRLEQMFKRIVSKGGKPAGRYTAAEIIAAFDQVSESCCNDFDQPHPDQHVSLDRLIDTLEANREKLKSTV